MKRLTILIVALLALGGCSAALSAPEAPPQSRRPMRIVSLDYCADQYVLKLVDRERILALSPDAASDFSYMREAAEGLPSVRPRAEDVLVLQPDLVVMSYGGGPNAQAFFERAGVPVVNIGWVNDLDAVMSNMERIANELGEGERGRQASAEMRARVERLSTSVRTQSDGPTAMYMTPAGVTTGPGTLVHEMLAAAGFQNFEQVPGWRSIPLETLAYSHPDVIAAAYFDSWAAHPDAWSPMKHPVARAQLSERQVVPLRGAWTTCHGWFLMDAIEALADAREDFSAQ